MFFVLIFVAMCGASALPIQKSEKNYLVPFDVSVNNEIEDRKVNIAMISEKSPSVNPVEVKLQRRRVRRYLTRGGVCSGNLIMMKYFGCISCEE